MSEKTKQEDEHQERVNHYRNLITTNARMSGSHMRIYNFWCSRIGPPMAYEMARVAFSDNRRYQMLKGRHALS